jgi:hypothetical protein
VGDGFKMSRDDYMRDTDGNGKSDYCAVIKVPGRGWEARCYRALESGFDTRTTVDTSPPDDIKEMLYFYEGILFWFRFIDDMKDYGEVLDLYTAGGLKIDETEVKPLPSQLLEGSTTSSLEDRIQKTKGLQFDGINQFLRLGDGPDLGFGHKISLPTMRAVCFWVKFEEFTNNAHIVDFGNGAGQDNYFIGIIGKGDTDMGDSAELRPVGCASDAGMVLPTGPSGAQPVPTMTPQELMKTTDANVNEYTRNNWKIDSAKPPKNALNASKRSPGAAPKTATLLFEVWNGKQRLQHIKVQKAIKLKTWTHVCITTATGDGVRPAIQIWVDGSMMAEDPNGYLPQTSFTTNNYLGKSNWINETSKYENKAELFKGSLFDVRAYNQGMPADKIKKTIAWGRKRLA